MTFPYYEGSARPARLPNKLSPEAEFLLLMDLKRNTEERLDRLCREIYGPGDYTPTAQLRGMRPKAVLSGERPAPAQELPHTDPATEFVERCSVRVFTLEARQAQGQPLTKAEAAQVKGLKRFLAERLPRSGLCQAAPVVPLFKGGRNV